MYAYTSLLENARFAARRLALIACSVDAATVPSVSASALLKKYNHESSFGLFGVKKKALANAIAWPKGRACMPLPLAKKIP